MNSIKILDQQLGYKNEIIAKPLLEKFFNCKLVKTDDFATFDFYSDECLIELKSRRNTKNHYPDTMVGYNKIRYAFYCGKPVYFCFLFTDGLFYYEFNKDDLNNGNIIIKKGGTVRRGMNEIKDYAYIKTNMLKPII